MRRRVRNKKLRELSERRGKMRENQQWLTEREEERKAYGDRSHEFKMKLSNEDLSMYLKGQSYL